MSNQPTAPVPNYDPGTTRKLSVSSLLSLICGILGCIPFATGGLAVILGIVGFFRTANPMKKGRWMAVVGTLLGLVSLALWTFGFGGMILALVLGTSGPRVAAHDLIQAAAVGDVAKVKTLEEGLSDDDVDFFIQHVQSHGKFVDTTFSSTSINNNTAEVVGTAKFDSGTYDVDASLVNDGAWKVTRMKLAK